MNEKFGGWQEIGSSSLAGYKGDRCWPLVLAILITMFMKSEFYRGCATTLSKGTQITDVAAQTTLQQSTANPFPALQYSH